MKKKGGTRIYRMVTEWTQIQMDRKSPTILGKLQYFTKLNSAAIWGWFPWNKPWFQGSGEQWGRDDRQLVGWSVCHPGRNMPTFGSIQSRTLYEFNRQENGMQTAVYIPLATSKHHQFKRYLFSRRSWKGSKATSATVRFLLEGISWIDIYIYIISG